MNTVLRKSLFTASVAAVLALQSACAAPLTDNTDEAYEIDGTHTHITWEVDRFGFAGTVGSFTDISGLVFLDEADPTKSEVSARIGLAGLRSDLEEREEIIRGPYWLNAAEYPEITFRSTEVKLVDAVDCEGRCATVVGEMALKGVTAPLTLHVTLNKLGVDPVTKRQAAGFTAHGSFQRSEFGVTTAVGPIGDIVRFRIEALAIKKVFVSPEANDTERD